MQNHPRLFSHSIRGWEQLTQLGLFCRELKKDMKLDRELSVEKGESHWLLWSKKVSIFSTFASTKLEGPAAGLRPVGIVW